MASKSLFMTLHASVRASKRRPKLVAAVLLICVVLTPSVWVRHTNAAGTIPVGLPDYLFLGLANGPGGVDWMTESGVRWNARYQYLAGGANTGSGWATWNSNGDFAAYYMQDSAANGYLPVFTYYQLLQSRPGGGNEGQANYTNLNTPSTMRAYYDDFKLLLTKIKAFNKPVIVHVEPDLFGYMQQRVVNGTNSAASVNASVASSGHPDVQGLPNTFQGFNWALLKLRDQYAPNAIMAMHVSAWTTGIDIGSNSDPNLNVAAEAQKVVSFHNTAGIVGNPSGISSYNLLFFDPLDRDAAFYEYQYGAGKSRWWDESNQKFPNFNRYHQYLKSVTDGTNRRALLWQVPIGNTKMRTVNNSWGHYQDNRVQYWLGGYPNDGHLQALANASVIGILFGRGADGPTTYDDTAGDGVTNPAAINGNTQVATVADDDGGYLRQVAQRYYQSPYRFGSSPAPTATRTVVPTPTRTVVPTPTRTPMPGSTPTPTRTFVPGVTTNVYTDGLAGGWGDWSWNPLTRNLNNASPVHGGTRSIAVTYTGGWSGFQVGRSAALNLAGYDVLRFWIRGSGTPGPIEVRVGNANTFVRQTVTPAANAWTQVEVPIASLAAQGVTYIWWQNMSASAQPTVYLDDIAFIDK